MTEQDRNILRIARIFGESELDMPPGFTLAAVMARQNGVDVLNVLGLRDHGCPNRIQSRSIFQPCILQSSDIRLELFPDQTPIERSSMNAWDSKELVAAVKKTGRKNFLIAALWSEACLAFPALQMLEEGYGVYAVEDASGGTTKTAHDAAIRRVEQAGGVSLTALQVLLELQRDWARKEHYDEVMAVVKEHCGAYGQGVEYASTMVHKAPASRKH